jgi:alpha-1,3-rhamnosyl/mannosyltransferase
MTLRVGVNLLWMVPGVVGGSEDATVALLAAVVDAQPDVEPVVFALPSFARAHPDLAGRLEVVTAPVDGRSKPRRVMVENTWLPRAGRRAGIALMHHAGGVLPPGDRGPATVTIHDLQPLDLPANFSALKQRYLSLTLGPSARRAAMTAVPSEFTRARAIDRLGADPDRVGVVPWSVPAPAPTDQTSVPVEGPFVLYPAITYPHKNHRVLLDAFAAVTDRPGLKLVLIGGPGPSEAAVAERMARPDLRGRVVRLGRVTSAQRDALMAHAALVVVPSRYEGFGLPALEAMAAGTPVVVADIPALAEVTPPDAPRVGVDDVAGWTRAVTMLAGDGARRAELSAAGRRAAAVFSPQRTAAAMVDLWHRAVATTSS